MAQLQKCDWVCAQSPSGLLLSVVESAKVLLHNKTTLFNVCSHNSVVPE